MKYRKEIGGKTEAKIGQNRFSRYISLYKITLYQYKKKSSLQDNCKLPFSCDSCRIQTCNLLIRSQMLYSVELRSQALLEINCNKVK